MILCTTENSAVQKLAVIIVVLVLVFLVLVLVRMNLFLFSPFALI